jgi:predicted acylesterase/phospholipase RssA
MLGSAREIAPCASVGLSVITARARGVLQASRSKAAFARAALANVLARNRLAAHLERVIFHSARAASPARATDAFGLTRIALDERNTDDALLASGSIPLVCDPVAIAGAPRSDYWDGGLIDYHLPLPYRELDGLVLYPHFVLHVTPGWLDKHLPWRRRQSAHPWLDNVLLISPTPAFLARMPRHKLPDRTDFRRCGADQAARMRDWKRAIAQGARFANEAMARLRRPDPSVLLPL